MLESLFNKFTDFRFLTILEKRLPHCRFFMNFAKFLTASAMSVDVVQVNLMVILVNRHLSTGLHGFPNCPMILKYPKGGHINLRYEKDTYKLLALLVLLCHSCFVPKKQKFALILNSGYM